MKKVSKRTWNYRVMAHENPLRPDDDIYFQIHEVHYKNMRPHAYSTNGAKIGGESMAEFNFVFKNMKVAMKQPIIWAGKKFPRKFRGIIKSK
jgi:hypothetical protein